MSGIPKGPAFALLFAGSLALASWHLAAAAEKDLTVFDFDATSDTATSFSPVLPPPATADPAASPTALHGAAATATPSESSSSTPTASGTPTASATPTPTPEAAAGTAIVQVEDQEAAEPAAEEPGPVALSSPEILVERAGAVAQADEIPLDGRIHSAKSGGEFLFTGDTATLSLAGGHALAPGQEILSFRLSNPVIDPVGGADLGRLVAVSGVLKVTRVDGDEVLARVTKSYQDVRVGDSFRLRGEKIPHHRPKALAGDLRGCLVAIRGYYELAAKGEVVYLDLGSAQGVEPGLRFTVQRKYPTEARRDSFDSAPIEANGDLGQVEVLSVLRNTSAAVVIRSSNVMKVGDRVRLR